MRITRRLLVALSVTLLWFSLAWVSASSQPFMWPNAWSEDAEEIQALIADEALPSGQRFRTASLSGVATFNPFTSSGTNEVLINGDTRGASLLFRGPDSEEWLPYAAESCCVFVDGRVIDVVLRDNIRWSDGTPVTVADYIFRYQAEIDPDVGSNSFDGWFIGDEVIVLEQTSDNSMRFTFPEADRLAFFTLAIHRPAPSHILGEIYNEGGAEALRAAWGTETNPSELVWTGPWILSSYLPDERMVFRRNPFFGEWNVDEAGNPLPYLEEISYAIADQQAQFNLYLAGELDAYSPSNLDEIGVINQAVADGELEAVVLESYGIVTGRLFYVFNWNLARDPWLETLFRDVRFRQAMSHLTDREAIIELVYSGAAQPAYNDVSPALDFFYNPDAPRFSFDPEAASALLAELGFEERNAQGFLMDDSGRHISFTLATNAGNAEREQTIQIIADTMRDYGIEVNTIALDFNLLVDQLISTGDDRPFEAILISIGGGSRDWPFGNNVLLCDANLRMYNRSGECFTEAEQRINDLTLQGRATLDNDEAQAIAFEIQEEFNTMQPIIHTAFQDAHVSWLERVAGAHPEELLSTVLGTRQLILTFMR